MCVNVTYWSGMVCLFVFGNPLSCDRSVLLFDVLSLSDL